MSETSKSKSGYFTHFFFYLRSTQSWIGMLVFVAFFILYESMAPTLLSSSNFGSDGGDYLTAVLTGGVPHPTGYPLYLLLSDIFQLLPFGNPIWKQAQLSIFFGAWTCSLAYLLAIRFSKNIPKTISIVSGLLTALAIGLAPIVWSQSVIIEVYSLNSFFVLSGLLWLITIIQLEKSETNKIRDYYSFLLPTFILGLGLGNHITILFLYPLFAIALFSLWRKKFNRGFILLCAIGLISGVFTYLIIPFRAQNLSVISWGNPSTLQGFWWLISGGTYSEIAFSISPSEFFTRLIAWAGLFAKQFGLIGALLGIVGLVNHSGSKYFQWSLIYTFVVYSVFSIGYQTNDSVVYLIPSLICFGIWLGFGIQYIWQLKYKSLKLGWLVSGFFVVNLLFLLPSNFTSVDPRNGDLSEYAQSSLALSSPSGILYPATDGETFSLWYYQYAMGQRQDVVIVSKGLLQFPWYQQFLKDKYPDIQFEN